jgi:hypothetical protein
MDEPISSELAATVWTLRDTWLAAVAAIPACDDALSAELAS